jgi:pSer/pThr/pTyr-binding forkhead associated (FHA) protein
MGTRLSLKHLSGSKANTEENLALPPEREILFGRDPACHVRYDENDDLVSRKHLKIVAMDEQPSRYMVVDLGSRNGTFLNRQRVFGAAVLLPGARVQLGAGGPEFEFGLLVQEPTKSRSVKTDRGRSGNHPLRNGWLGKWTLVILLIGAAGAAGYAAWIRVTPVWWEWRAAHAAREAAAKSIAAAALASVANIEFEWSVFDKQTGARLSLAYIPNERMSQAAPVPLLEGAPDTLPAFVLGPDRRVEPLLVPVGSAHAGKAFGGKWTSKGLIVSSTGAVLTASPDLRPWNTPRYWTPEQPAGALLAAESRTAESMTVTQVVPLAASQFPRWTSAESAFFAEQLLRNSHKTGAVSSAPPEELPSSSPVWQRAAAPFALPTGSQYDVHGRQVSSSDLGVDVTATVAASGRTLKARLSGESSGIWLAAVEAEGPPLQGVRMPQLENAATLPRNKHLVWVIGSEIETAEILGTTEDGRIELQASGCIQGGVVFDQNGHVLALCVPGSRSKTGAGIAIPIRFAVDLLGGAANGHAWQP